MTRTDLLAPATYADRILAGDDAALDAPALQALLSGQADLWDVMAAADRVRRDRFGTEVRLCSIVNAKLGGCPEDCGFCSQSRHAATGVGTERFISTDEAVAAARKAREQKATALGLVTATRGLEDDTAALSKVLDDVRAVKAAGHTEVHGSFGFVSESSLRELKEAGLTELNHNLETGRSFFGEVVTSHTYDDRIDTIKAAKAVGLRTCVGGIMGMGESPRHRAELAMQLRELDVDEVPLNFLVSIEGTRLREIAPLPPREMLRIIACFRLALPRPNIFIAAGRQHLGHLQSLVFSAGASGLMVGDFLTTDNRKVQDDLDMIEELGLVAKSCGGPSLEMDGAKDRVALPVIA